jgi:hypothetical protein
MSNFDQDQTFGFNTLRISPTNTRPVTRQGTILPEFEGMIQTPWGGQSPAIRSNRPLPTPPNLFRLNQSQHSFLQSPNEVDDLRSQLLNANRLNERLQRQLDANQQRMASLETSQLQMTAQVQQLIAALQAQQPPLPPFIPPSQRPSPPNSPPRSQRSLPPIPATGNLSTGKEPEVKNPEVYDGRDTRGAVQFVRECEDVFFLRPSRFPGDDVKIRYAITYLKGDIKYFFQSLLEQPAKFYTNYPDWQTFRNYIVNTYGEGSLSQVAEHEIRSLRQTSSVSSYWSQFSAIASRLSWNEEALFSQFRQGLSDRIKDLESQLPQPLTTLHNLKEWAVNVDNRMYQRQLEKKTQTTTKPPTNFNRSPNPPAPSPPKPPSSSNQRTTDANNERAHSKPVPINIDASKIRAPLTEAQKEERRKLGLCMYCGDKDHRVFNCPKRAKLSANAVSTSSPTVTETKPEEPKIVELGN